jgi:hypothetical protein
MKPCLLPKPHERILARRSRCYTAPPEYRTETLLSNARTCPHSVRHLSIESLLGTLLLEGVGKAWKELNVSGAVKQRKERKHTKLVSGAIIAIDGKIVGEGC